MKMFWVNERDVMLKSINTQVKADFHIKFTIPASANGFMEIWKGVCQQKVREK